MEALLLFVFIIPMFAFVPQYRQVKVLGRPIVHKVIDISHAFNRRADDVFSSPDDEINDTLDDEYKFKSLQGSHLKSRQGSTRTDSNILLKYFIPGFIIIWAVGYSGLALVETTGEGLGDMGGIIGASFVVILTLALVGAAAFETFKPIDE
mmetsp:Transcript_18288/g.18368  ORF Transcript_18288/g.18368 Transcript_18288/m.18368 type:complete len:151 (-) Transcript_18288:312-764(-)